MLHLINSHAHRFPLANGRCHLVTFSPPYANGIRDYATEGQLGQEQVIDCEGWMKGEVCGQCYVCNLLIVAREVWRVLHTRGMFVLNLGDVRLEGQPAMIPSIVCLALKKAGGRLVHDVVWSKPNPMPESMKRRPTRSYDMVYMFAKSPDYFCDMEAVKEPTADGYTRNLRDVWSIATHSYPGSHFATWPPELVNLIIKMCTSERGACPTCGNQWERVIEKTSRLEPTRKNQGLGNTFLPRVGTGNASKLHHVAETKTTGWRPTCKCPAHEPTPALVLDPFCGSGTTLQEARRLGRFAIGCDLSMTYLQECAIPRLNLRELAGEAIKGGMAFEGLPLFQKGV